MVALWGRREAEEVRNAQCTSEDAGFRDGESRSVGCVFDKPWNGGGSPSVCQAAVCVMVWKLSCSCALGVGGKDLRPRRAPGSAQRM